MGHLKPTAPKICPGTPLYRSTKILKLQQDLAVKWVHYKSITESIEQVHCMIGIHELSIAQYRNQQEHCINNIQALLCWLSLLAAVFSITSTVSRDIDTPSIKSQTDAVGAALSFIKLIVLLSSFLC